MKLYYHPASINSRRVRMVAALLGLPLEMQVIDLWTGAQRTPDYLKLNPNGSVPALEDEGFVLWESSVICQYLCDTQGAGSLFPQAPRARADVARWQAWDLAHFKPTLRVFTFERLFKPALGLGAADARAIDQAEQELTRYAKVLDDHLATRAYIAGEHLTLADVCVATSLSYAEEARVSLSPFPHLLRWFELQQGQPAWQQTLPSQR